MTKDTIRFSTASQHDVPQLCDLLNCLFCQESEFTPSREAQSKGLTEIISRLDVGEIIVAQTDNEIIGMLNLLFTVSTALGSRVALLEDMVVSPKFRGEGIGKGLIDYAITSARSQGCKRITLLTDADNSSAHRFYQSIGFVRSSMVPFRYDLQEV